MLFVENNLTVPLLALALVLVLDLALALTLVLVVSTGIGLGLGRYYLDVPIRVAKERKKRSFLGFGDWWHWLRAENIGKIGKEGKRDVVVIALTSALFDLST